MACRGIQIREKSRVLAGQLGNVQLKGEVYP